jgi:hypothetical protein
MAKKPKIVTFEDKKYISVDDLIDGMVTMLVRYTETSDIDVSEWESVRASAFDVLLKNELNLPEEEERFRKHYVFQRFIRRTLGE